MKKPTPLGQRIRKARESAGLSQTELAKRAAIPTGQPGVSDIESRPDPVQLKIYRRIFAALRRAGVEVTLDGE